jgi:molecular chaperone DnaK
MATFGIDFGTTTSGVVQVLGGRRVDYGDDAGKPLPSIVVIDTATGELSGGREAWNRRFELEQDGKHHVIPSIKTFLASDRHWPTATRIWTPEGIAAYVFEQLNTQVVRRGIRAGIGSATVAIPVGMKAASRRTLRAAAAKAGIKIESFVSESTAAVFRYLPEYRHLHRVVVFDWGGGTLDVSVLEFRSTGVFELALGGTSTAGNALDHQIALHIHGRIMDSRGERRGFDEMDPHDQAQLQFRAEIAKQQLSLVEATPVSMMNYDGDSVHLSLTREALTPVVRPAVAEAIALLERTIHRAGLTVDAVDAILLVGGSSQLWLLHSELSADPRFKGRYRIAEAPEWDVAHGAALVSSNPGAYELAETLALRLSDGSSMELARPGDRPGVGRRALSLVLTEDAPEAHLVIERRSTLDSLPKPALQFSTPTLGFLNEELAFTFGLTPDLTFAASAKSARQPESPASDREIEDLRFGYALGSV